LGKFPNISRVYLAGYRSIAAIATNKKPPVKGE
jgi:hypothetical protein